MQQNAAKQGKELSELQSVLEKREKEKQSLQQRLNVANQQLKEATSDRSLAQKMQFKNQEDLNNLRTSYFEKCESEQELIELITELKEKLLVASQYYHRIQQKYPELMDETKY